MDHLKVKFNCFLSPIIPNVNYEIAGHFCKNERIDKSHWICDYSDDIFQTLLQTEQSRRLIYFRSQQNDNREMLLHLLRKASGTHKLARTTLHLATYLIDCFMDVYTIRADKLNLTAITCLIIAAKIEEADMNMPKFVDLNKLVDNAYMLSELKNVEFKVLNTLNFDLIRPTTATFAEYFAHDIATLDDYHTYIRNWHNGTLYLKRQQRQLQKTLLPLYTSYEEMVNNLNETLFELVDISLNHIKFANARPSIMAAACMAVVRQIHCIASIWTPYLIKITKYTEEVISPFVDAIIVLYKINTNKLQTKPIINATNSSSNLMDSPDSGIISLGDIKSVTSDNDDDDDENDEEYGEGNDDDDDEEDDAYHCLEYPVLAKRRRLY